MLFGCCLPGGPYDAQRAQRLAQAAFRPAVFQRNSSPDGKTAVCACSVGGAVFVRWFLRCCAAETPYSAASEAASEVFPEASSDTASDAAPDAVSEEPSLTGVPLTRFSKSSFASR